MASLNKVILIGNLGRDPEVRYTQGGVAVANFSIATSERWTNKQTGQPEERTEWHRIVVFNKLAELCKEYLAKGRSIYVEGKLQTRQWDDKDGNKRYTTEVVAQNIQFLDRRGAATSVPQEAPQPQEAAAAVPVPAAAVGGDGGPPPFNEEDDIPF